MRPGLHGHRFVLCLLTLALWLEMNAGCEITTFGNLVTTGTTGGGTGGGGTSSAPHLLGSSFLVASSALAQSQPAVGYFDHDPLSGRRYAAAWIETDANSQNSSVRCRQVIIAASGIVTGSAVAVLTTTQVIARAPAVTSLIEAGRITAVIVWQQATVSTGGQGRATIAARNVTRNGDELSLGGGPQTVSGEAFEAFAPAIASAGTTLCLTVFLERTATQAPRLRGRMLGASGQPLGSDSFVIDQTDVSLAVRPAVAFNNRTGEFLVIWTGGASNNTNIRASIVAASPTAAGPKLSPFTVVASNSTRVPFGPQVAYNTARQEYLAVWRENGTGVTTRIARQKLDNAGAVPASSATFNLSGDRQSADKPVLAYGSALNQFLVAWQDNATSGGTPDIRGRLLLYDANLNVIEGDDFSIATGTPQQTDPAVAFDSASNDWLVLYVEGTTLRGQRVKPSA
ncbi:MAG: hypothetical protein HY814_11440 [Candidatus Riflebacteria bacterium]|nr:hypothetical protein [Candidatus Riflebacteria bacterium]